MNQLRYFIWIIVTFALMTIISSANMTAINISLRINQSDYVIVDGKEKVELEFGDFRLLQADDLRKLSDDLIHISDLIFYDGGEFLEAELLAINLNTHDSDWQDVLDNPHTDIFYVIRLKNRVRMFYGNIYRGILNENCPILPEVLNEQI